MGYRKNWYRNDDRAAQRAVFFSGWNASKKKYQPVYRREGKLELLRSILRCVQTALVVAATFIVLRGYEVLVTLR
jgi:hypothetical protein